jgi:protein SCO1
VLLSTKNIRILKNHYNLSISLPAWLAAPIIRKAIINPFRVFRLFSFSLLIPVFFSCKSASNQPAVCTDTTLPYYSDPAFTPHWKQTDTNTLFFQHQIAPFRLLNQLGDTITESSLTGKVYVAGFFFTACPGICRNLTLQLKRVQEKFIVDNRIMIVSYSVTPETDQPDRLLQYANTYGINSSKWWLLTGNRDSIYRLARRDYFADEDLGMQKTSQDFLHTENLLLIDQNRKIRGVYKGTSAAEVDWLIIDIQKLLQP